MGSERIAIVGIGVRHPDANSPQELWEHALSGGRAFRRLPPERRADGSPDRFALAATTAALADAGFPEGDGLPKPSTGVVFGYGLTRANTATFAGGLADTIVGRVRDHFGLGEGPTLDGARSPSLLCVATAAQALLDREMDVAIVGGLDLSIGPFEVSDGFRSGEGAGVVVLTRESDAVARGDKIYAVVSGWGASAEELGDGTKAAAGILGLLKGALALHHQVIPPGAGQDTPWRAELFPTDVPPRADVSAMGVHIALEQAAGVTRRTELTKRTTALTSLRQDTELLLLDADDLGRLRDRVTQVAARAPALTLAGLAGMLAGDLADRPARAAVVTSSPEDAERKLERIVAALDAGETALFAPAEGVFLDNRTVAPKLAFLFPGRGSGRGVGAIRRRFPAADEVFHSATLSGDPAAPEVVQARVVTGSLAGLSVLHALDIEADIVVGHSLGELTALAWAGAMSGPELQELAHIRGQVMAKASAGGGGMAALVIDPEGAERLMAGHPVVIAGYESPSQTVVSGAAEAVDAVCAKAAAEGVTAIRIKVPHAFHSPLVRPAAEAMTDRLAARRFEPLVGQVASTVTGDVLAPDTDPRALLVDQVLLPVRFAEAAARAARDVDLLIEVGPAHGLAGLLGQIAPDKPVLALDTDSASMRPLLTAVGAAFVLGAPVDTSALFIDRILLALDGELGGRPRSREAAPAIESGLVTPLRQDGDGGGAASARDSTPLSPADAAPAHAGAATLEPPAADTAPDGRDVAGIGPWVRPFSVDHVEERRPRVDVGVGAPGRWRVFASEGHPLAEPLGVALAKAGIGGGVLLCLPNDGEPDVDLVPAAGEAAVAVEESRFVVVRPRLGASGPARMVRRQAPTVRTTVVGLVDTEPSTPDSIAVAVSRVVGEVAATNWFSEVRYDADGMRTVPVLKALTPPAGPVGSSPLDSDDVLLVTGAGLCVTAECALAMARDSSAKLALLGRADPAEDTQLAANLARMAVSGVRFRYERADLTSATEIAAAVARFEAELGPVTAVLHGTPVSLSEEDFERTPGPEIAALRAVLEAVDQDKIKLLVTFGGVIGPDSAHCSTATDWMSSLTVKFGEEHPKARVLAVRWSAWSDPSGGRKLTRDGITPISVEQGVAALRQVLGDPTAGPVLVVSGRAAGLPVLDDAEPPESRFVDQVVVHCPGVELITEAELSAGDDPYLDDHLVDDEPHFPAVIAMEAMAQVASALTGSESAPLLENVEFLRPVTVRPGGSTRIRLAALVRDAETVDIALRSAESGFSADHFRATVKARNDLPLSDDPDPRASAVALDPSTELYGSLLSEGKRFQRVLAYRKISARHAVAELGTTSPAPWFAAHLPQRLLLADPGTRDAVMHAIQCCVPDAILLPQGVERLHLAQRSEQDTEFVVMDARERCQDGDTHTYDVDVRTPDGRVVERWEGLALRAVRRDGVGPWAPALLGSLVERSLERVLGGSRSVAVEPAADGLTFAVAGSGRHACHVESAVERDWPSLLDADQLVLRDLLAAQANDTVAVAGARILGALEPLRETGATSQALTLDRVHPDGWVVLSTGDAKIATWATTVKGRADPVVFAVLSGEGR